MALTPARCARSVRRCLNGVSGVGFGGTEYMLMALSAEAVASRVMSGENLRDVIPLACARGIVKRGVNLKGLDFVFREAEREWM